MNSKRLVIFLCLWAVFTCILIDQAESFTARAGSKRRRRGRGKKRDDIHSTYNKERAVLSLIWVGCPVISVKECEAFFLNTVKNLFILSQTGFSNVFSNFIAKMARNCRLTHVENNS